MQRHVGGPVEFDEEIGPDTKMRITEAATPSGGVVTMLRDISATERDLARARLAVEAAALSKLDYLGTVTSAVVLPVNAIIGNMELLLCACRDIEHESLRHIVRSRDLGRRLLKKIDELLGTFKLSGAVIQLDFAEFEPGVIVDDAIESLRQHADARAVELRVSSSYHGNLWGDAGRFRLAVLSVLRAVIEAGRRTSVVVDMFASPVEGSRLRLTVDVTESGMSDRARAGLLAQLKRAANADQTDAISAVGFRLAHAIARAMGGGLSGLSQSANRQTIRLEVSLDAAPGGLAEQRAA